MSERTIEMKAAVAVPRVRAHPLAHLGGIHLTVALLAGSGALCSTCGRGTRVTSKRWARCKFCGERVRRRPMDDVAADLKRVALGRLMYIGLRGRAGR